jgi:hypothetical protein
MRGSGDMQRCVARRYEVMNCSEEVRVGILAARSSPDWTNCEIGHCVKPSRRLYVIVRRDCAKEGKQGSVDGGIELPTWSGHPHSLPDAAGEAQARSTAHTSIGERKGGLAKPT